MIRASVCLSGTALLAFLFDVTFGDHQLKGNILLNKITTDDLSLVWHCQAESSNGDSFGSLNPNNLFHKLDTGWCFIGARHVSSTTIDIGAFIPSLLPSKKKITDDTKRNEAVYVTDNIYWYHNNYSFGFAPNKKIFQNDGDTYDPTDAYRLSISPLPYSPETRTLRFRAGAYINDSPDNYLQVFYYCPRLTPDIPIAPSRERIPNEILLNKVSIDDLVTVYECLSMGDENAAFGSLRVSAFYEYGDRSFYWFIGARRHGSDIVDIGAFIPSSIAASYTPIDETISTGYIEWYYNDISFGFAPNKDISQKNGDTAHVEDPYRLSITRQPDSNFEQGSRVGSTGNNVNDYFQVFYYCGYVALPPPSSSSTAKPAPPVAKPASSTTKPAPPVTKPASSTAKPAPPVAKPASSTTKPAPPVAKPASSTTKTACPTKTRSRKPPKKTKSPRRPLSYSVN
jgi:hypothetical protein